MKSLILSLFLLVSCSHPIEEKCGPKKFYHKGQWIKIKKVKAMKAWQTAYFQVCQNVKKP